MEVFLSIMSKDKSRISHAISRIKVEGKKVKKKKVGFNDLLNLTIFALLFILMITALVKMDVFNMMLSSIIDSPTEYSLLSDIKDVCDEARESSADEIKSRDPVLVVELDEYVAPKPDPKKYDSAFENYTDDTIEVHYHKERKYKSWFHYMEVKIKHPSQIRVALANNQYAKKGKIRKLPSEISADVNAVCAVNGCFYNVRWGGIFIHRRELLRDRPFGIDVLLIDSNGDFHIVEDRKLKSSGLLEEYDIINALSFGPELVHDGQELTITKRDWEPSTNEPRTAICQYDDPLHYLVVLAEGRNSQSVGVTMQTFAHEVAATNVKTAYNLDGGRSGTMIIGNRLKNKVGWGSEKPQSDIIYFATAIDN